MNKILFALLIACGVIISTSHVVFTNSGQPPAGHTNAPGDQGSCAKSGCHTGAGNPNDNSSNVVLFNFNNNNQTYQPGNTYNVTITNTGTNGPNTRWGFQTTVLDLSNNFAGTLTRTNLTTTSIATFNNRTYIGHYNANSTTNSWSFQWTAPSTNIGDVIFYVASNTANGIGSSGDIIYVDTFIIRAPIATPPPTANFTASNTTICQGQSVTFTDNSSSDVTAWSWNFGAGAIPATANTKGPHTVTYSTSGLKTVSLTVTGPGGTATETKTNYITVNALPNASAGSNVSICRGNSTVLNASGGTSYSWSPATGLSATNVFNPTASPTITTTYTVTVTDANSCSATAQVTVTVLNLPNVSFTANNNTGCVPHAVQFTNNTPNTLSCFWNFDDGNNSAVCSPTHTYQAPSTYNVSLTVTDNNNCTASAQQTITVFPTPNASAGNDIAICTGGSALLTGSGGTSYLWSTGATTQSITVAPVTDTLYTVTVTDANGCTATDDVLVSISGSLQITVSNDTTICEGNAVQLTASGGNSFTWSPVSGLSNANSPSPVASPAATTTYQVIVSDGVCTDSASVTIEVTPAINANIMNDTTILVTNNNLPSVALYASGGTQYAWLPAAGLDNPASATPVLNLSALSLTTDTTLIYTVIISNGACADTLSVSITVNFVVGIAAKQAHAHHNLSIYPNPSQGNFFIQSDQRVVKIFLIDTNGKKYSIPTSHSEANLIHVNVALPEGIYMLYVETQNLSPFVYRLVLY
jgi:PKD repeat protein